MKFKSIGAWLDMAGCPNRCRHCWLGHGANGNLTHDDLRFVAEAFRPFTDDLEVFSWYREPDFREDYRELWELEATLSSSKTPHFELMSVWRAARDPAYIPWLASLGVQQMQLTLFGGEKLTDQYTGRKGAWADIMRSIERLQAHGIVPRIQVFTDQVTARDLAPVEALIKELDCPAFTHNGSCLGAGLSLYDIRATLDTLALLPETLVKKSLEHWNAKQPQDFFGEPESTLYERLADANGTASLASEAPFFQLDYRMNVHLNGFADAPAFCLGNLRADGAEAVLTRYLEHGSPAQHVRHNVPLGELVRTCGDPQSQRLFDQDDFIDYLLERYCNYYAQ